MSLYASELWADAKGCQTALDSHATSYHNCIKTLIHVPRRANSHAACDATDLPYFKHLIQWKTVSFAFNLLKSKSPFLQRHKYYFTIYSDMFRTIKKNFNDNYSIGNVFFNDLDAIRVRIGFVHDREERSNYRVQ